MLLAIALILLVLWLLGFIVVPVGGSLVHILCDHRDHHGDPSLRSASTIGLTPIPLMHAGASPGRLVSRRRTSCEAGRMVGVPVPQ